MQPTDVSVIVSSNNGGASLNGPPNGIGAPVSQLPSVPSSGPGLDKDPYRGVVIVLLVAAIVGMAGAFETGLRLGNPVLIDAAVTLGLAAGILIGVARAQLTRMQPPKQAPEEAPAPEPPPEVPESTKPGAAYEKIRLRTIAILRDLRARLPLWPWYQKAEQIGFIRLGTSLAGVIAIWSVLRLDLYLPVPTPKWAEIVAGLFLVAAGLAATAAHYLTSVDPVQFPEGPELRKGSRTVAWLLLIAAVSVGIAWRGLPVSRNWVPPEIILRIMHFAVVVLNAAICFQLVMLKRSQNEEPQRFSLDIGVLSVFGSRNNILASVLDSAEQQLGIDLRSTWALTVVRQSLEPLALSLLLAGWLSTSLTVVGTQDQGLVERLGVPVGGQPLEPGLHIHLPWPIDHVFRIPVKRVQSLTVGHEGQEEGGPENVLWARQHAANEYTLLLGNGRDLITVDAAVVYRITDARAWRYHTQNPADALKAVAYRAVMRNTVNRTLTEALSENVAALTSRMRAMVQQDADALGLGVQVEAFTVGGMHPPTIVAPAYQAVVSAELGKVTTIVNAQVYRNQTVPAAESSVLKSANAARSEGAEALAKAAGQAWAFRTLESQYQASPEEYRFRRRLETFEKSLADHRYAIVDFRFLRDGGELWLTQ